MGKRTGTQSGGSARFGIFLTNNVAEDIKHAILAAERKRGAK